jgi:hypothetical protein
VSRHTFSVQAAGAGSHKPKSWRRRPWQRFVDELQAIDFHHRSDRFEVHGYDSVDSEGVDVSIVAVGDDECTITFDTVT